MQTQTRTETLPAAPDDLFGALVHNTTDAVLIVDDDNAVRYASPATATVFGGQPPPLAALPDLFLLADRGAVARALDLVRRGRPPAPHGEWQVLRVDGRLRRVEVSYRDLRADLAIAGLVVTIRDVTE